MPFRPRVSIALTFETDEHRSGRVRMRLGIAAVLVLRDSDAQRRLVALI